ncbi:hypothetical protein ElyMa_004270700 [Elysia marginata]|uniref:Uncharacterized protein n=1 Tax=Elysia marginata TaxID=1093978 RepID=A0AAV4GUP3_9GAST|nr:hypothetical protein ElyMa_004270700 [Elysia marginata]
MWENVLRSLVSNRSVEFAGCFYRRASLWTSCLCEVRAWEQMKKRKDGWVEKKSREEGELRLKTNEDLDQLRSIAQDRQQWKGLTTKIREAAEASRSED